MPSTNLPASPFDLVVLGGGIMGLSTAYEAMRMGMRVAVLDPGPLSGKPAEGAPEDERERRASWAAAGILVRRAGVLGISAFRNFHLRAVPLYPDWLDQLRADSGIEVPWSCPGDYQVFVGDDPETRRMIGARESQLRRERASRFTRMDAWPEFLAPHGAPGLVRAYHFPDEAAVNNRVLLEALETALRNGGAVVHPGTRARRITRANGLHAIETGDDTLHAARVLVAAGAWCNDPLALLGFALPLHPVKGQLALLRNFHGTRHLVHGGERFYLIPRGDFLIAGATTEPHVWEAGFNETGERHLAGELARFFPDVKPLWTDTWSGLRPCGDDRQPLLGWLDRDAGIAVATGLYKSGISLAPLAGRAMAELLAGEKPSADLRAFDPWRASAGLRRM